MIGYIQTIQYRIWLPRPSLEELLNYKTFSGFPPSDKIVADLRYLSHHFMEFPVVSSFTICDELGTASIDFL